jgi:hypothetical protein
VSDTGEPIEVLFNELGAPSRLGAVLFTAAADSATSITMSPKLCRAWTRISGSEPAAAKAWMLIRIAWRSGRSSLV